MTTLLIRPVEVETVDIDTPHWLPYLEDPRLGFEFIESYEVNGHADRIALAGVTTS